VPYLPCTGTVTYLKFMDTARMLRQVTQPPHIAEPLGLRDVATSRDSQRTKARVWLTPNTCFFTSP